MNLPDIWNPYTDGDYNTSLRLAVESLAENAGIDLLHVAGLSLMNLKRRDEALTLLKAACTLRPQSAHIYSNAGYVAEQVGMMQEAMYFAELGLRDFPEDNDLMLLKANSLVMQLRLDEAALVYQQVLERDPRHVQSIINLGNIARSKDDLDEANRRFDQAEAIEPDFRDIRFARATMYTQIGDDANAMRLLEPIAGNAVDAQFLLSLLYLSRGDYERGFRLYRARCNSIWYKAGNFVYPLDPFDHWTEAVDKRIAVHQEGGQGDMIQFVRYIPMLAEIAETVSLYTPPSLLRLFHHLPSNVTIHSSHDSFQRDDYDYVTTDCEMAYAFRTTLDTIPNQIPYLSVPETAIEARRLPASPLKRVGLCWAGGGQGDLNHRSYDARRSFDLSMYAPLAEAPVEFVSLQFDTRKDQTCEAFDRFTWASRGGTQVHRIPMLRPLDPSFDFLDTAAIIAQLDLVITVDTSIVHLAAALGKPTWLLSRYDCCWRWLKNRPDSPWYPGVLRVFGQKTYREWDQPIAEVTQALKEWASE